MRQREGISRNWQGRKREVVSTARGHERQHQTDFLERAGEAEDTVPISSFTWVQREDPAVRISAEGTNCSLFVKPEHSQMF